MTLIQRDDGPGAVEGRPHLPVTGELVGIRAHHQQIVRSLHRDEPRAGDMDRPGAADRADRRAHRRLELDHRGARRLPRVDGLAVDDQGQNGCPRVGVLQVRQGAQVDRDVVGVVPAPALDVGERRVAVWHLRRLPQHHPALVAGEVAALTIGQRAAHRFQRERHLLGAGQPCGDPDVGERAEVVGVGTPRRSAARR